MPELAEVAGGGAAVAEQLALALALMALEPDLSGDTRTDPGHTLKQQLLWASINFNQ